MRKLWIAGIALARLAGLGMGASGLAAQTPPDYTVRQLSPSGEAASRVGWGRRIDPRGEWVVFVGDVETAGAEAVYAIRRNGSDLHRLSPYGAAGAINGLYLSPDGRRALYTGDLDVNGLAELWSVELWGTAASAVKLNVPVTGVGVTYLRIPGTGDRIVYSVESASGKQVWSVPAAGPAAASIRLDPATVGDETILTAVLRPDAAQVAIQYADTVATTTRIVTVPISGPAAAAVPLAEANPGGCGAYVADFTPDSSHLVYAAFCPVVAGFALNQLWSVPAAGPASAAVSLGGSFADGGTISSMLLSPDSQRVVFRADRLVDERFELWSVPVAGPAAAIVRLNPTLVANGDVIDTFRISPDSTHVAYIADQASDERFFPYAVPVAGPSTAAVSLYQGVLAVAADATDLAFTPDSSRVVFRFDLALDERFDLYQAPVDGSAPQTRITNRGVPPAPARSVAPTWLVHPEGDRVIYVYDELAAGDRRGLGEQHLSTPYATDARLNGAPVSGGQVTDLELYPDGAGLLYRSDEVVNDKFELFTVDLRLLGDGFEDGATAAWPDLP